MSKFFDWRKISERKIAVLTVIVNIVAMGFSIHYAKKSVDASNSFNQKSFCYGKIQTLSGLVKDNLYVLPTKISGCAIEPENFCEQARLISERIRTDSFEISSLLAESSAYRKNYENLTKTMQEILPTLKQTDSTSDWFDKMLDIASDLNKIRINISEVNLLKENCNELN